MTATAAPVLALPPTPYVGLTPFAEGDAAFFFGRERERRLLAASILSSRLTILYGASGVGKSSLLRAGLVPDFRARAEDALARGLMPESLLVVCSAWRDDPVGAIAEAVESAVREQLGPRAPAPPPRTPRLDDLLLEWTRRLDARAAKLAPDADDAPRTELLLVLDQFEEYFLYHPDEDGEGTFAVELPRAVMREDLRTSFLIAIREDAYTQLDRFEGRIRNLFGSNFRLEHLDEQAARRAIEAPVERYNELLADGEEPYEVEPELVPAVVAQVRAGNISLGQTGGGTVETNGRGEVRVETPFLQLVLTRLWEEEQRAGSRTLRLETLERLGGAERLVRSHLDEALAELPESARRLTGSIFHQLVTPSGTKIVHAAPDLAGYAAVREEELAPVLNALAAKRILRPVDPAPGTTARRFEIFHDVLAGAIIEWRAGHEREQAERTAAARQRRVRRRLAAVAVGLLALVLVFAGLAAWAVWQRSQARHQAELAAKQAGIARSQALAASAISQIDADPELSLLLAVEAARASPTPEATNALRRGLTASRVRAAVPTRAAGVGLSPDGTRIVTVAVGDGRVRVWRAAGGAPVGGPLGAAAQSAAFDTTGRLVVTAGRDGAARVFETETGRRLLMIRAGSRPLVAARFSRDGRRIVVVRRDGAAQVFDARTGAPGASARIRRPTAIRFSPRGDALLVAGADGRVGVWRWQENDGPITIPTTRVVGPHVGFSDALAVADDGRFALVGGFAMLPGQRLELVRQALWIVDARTRGVRALEVPGGTGVASFGPDGRLLGTGGIETARIWDTRSGEQVAVLRGHVAPVTKIAFSADGATVLTGSDDGSVRLWASETGEPLGVFRGPVGPVSALAGPRGDAIATAADDAVRVWALDAVPARFQRRLPDVFEDPPVTEIVFARDGSHLVVVSQNGAWTLAARTGAVSRSFDPHSLPGEIDDVSPDGTLVAYAPGVDDARTGKSLLRLPLHAATFSRDSGRLAFVDLDSRVGIWSRDSGRVRILGRDAGAFDVGFGRGGAVITADERPRWAWRAGGGDRTKASRHDRPYDAVSVRGDVGLRRQGRVVAVYRDGSKPSFLFGHVKPVTDIELSPRSANAATASEDGTARVWDISTHVSITLRGHVGSVNGVSFSPDGSLVATAGADGTVRVWEAATGANVAVLRGGGRSLHVAGFSPDGRFIATGGDDRIVRLYDCEPCRPLDDLLALARSRVTRELTPQERRQFLG